MVFFSSKIYKSKKFSQQKKIVINCPYVSNEQNAEWSTTLANGQTINGICLNGFFGFVSRTCTNIGSTGIWSSISGSCDGISSFFFSMIILEIIIIIIDINECSTNNGGCNANANCTNTIGSFTCTCKSGYDGNGLNCSGNLFYLFIFLKKKTFNSHTHKKILTNVHWVLIIVISKQLV